MNIFNRNTTGTNGYQTVKIDDLTRVDHRYFNLQYTNNSDTMAEGSSQFVPCNVQQFYDVDIITQPQMWNVALCRFAISSSSIGRVYQPLGTTGGNTTMYVSLSYNGTYYDEPIVLPTVTTYNQVQVQVVYNINAFLNLLNAGYALAQTAVAGAGGPTGYGQVLVTYEPTSGLYYVNIPSWYGTGTIGTTGNGIGVHMSYQLYHRFGGFDVIENDPILYNNHDVTFVRYYSGNNLGNITYPVGTGGTGPSGGYMELAQDAAWPSSLEDINRLIITSTSLPITQEFRSNQFFSQFNSNVLGNGILQQAIVTDFFIGEDSPIVASSENFLYTPTLLRLASLVGTSPLRQLDLQAYVVTKFGALFPIVLGPTDSFDAKIVFIYKGLTS